MDACAVSWEFSTSSHLNCWCRDEKGNEGLPGPMTGVGEGRSVMAVCGIARLFRDPPVPGSLAPGLQAYNPSPLFRCVVGSN